jgi:hypothetical protein
MPRPDFPLNFPFQFRVSIQNEDIQLITTSDTKAIIQLVEIFDLEDEIANEFKVLLDPAMPERRNTVISLHNKPEKGSNYAYAALLECDLCGIKRGYFALFKSLSGDSEALAKECKEMHDFFNSEMDKTENFELIPKRSTSASL